MGYQKTRMTCRGTCAKEAKATPTVCKPNNSVNRRLPKLERLNTGYAKCRKVKNSKGVKTKEDDAEYPIWQRSVHSSLRTLN